MDNSSDKPSPLPEEKQNKDHQWDGSEAELVEDDDAAEYEEHHTGIKLCYTLQPKEIHSCILNSETYKERKKKMMFSLGFSFFFALLMFILYVFSKSILQLVLGILFLLLGLFEVFLYSTEIKKRVRCFSTGKKAFVEIYPDNIVVSENDKEWEIPLDGSLKCEELDNMMLIYLEDKRVFVVPLRCVEPDLVADVQAMILAGTSPKKDD